jgi:HK97 family phage major capsid protein/HK97 family phage prohead protease
MSKSIDEIRREVVGKPLSNSLTINRETDIDPEARTVKLAFASDKPVDNGWYGQIRLLMGEKNVRVQRLKSGAPLLDGHDWNRQIGVIEEYSFDSDGMARCTVRFSKNPAAEEIFQDVQDGIRRNISVGFMIWELALEKKSKSGPDIYVANDWEPYEVSIVAVPADISVGVGRELQIRQDPAADPETCPDCGMPMDECECMEGETNSDSTTTERKNMSKETIETPESPVVVQRSAELVLADEIRDWGRNFDCPEVATAYLRENAGGTFSKEAFFERVKANKPAPAQLPAEPAAAAAARQGAPRVELARNLPRFGTLRNFTGEDAAERALRFGNWFIALRGIEAGKANLGAFARASKFCSDNGIVMDRAMGEGVNESGGFLVPEEFGNDLIDLREQYGVFRRNAKMVPMKGDTRSDPRRAGGLTAYFEGEGDAITASDKSWDRVALTAKKLTALGRYSNEINEDAVINMADDLAGEIAYAFANKEDLCGFTGDGTSTYGGMQGITTKIKGLSGTIANIAGLVVATGTGYGTNYGSAVLTDFEAVVGLLPQYADTPNAKWYVHRSFYWNVMKKLELAAGGVTSGEIQAARQARFLGYDVEVTQVMPKVSATSQVCAILGDLRLGASFGSRRDTTIAISEHSRFANDQLEIRGTERFDINIHDVGNASATAGLRVQGPIVGLITAAS